VFTQERVSGHVVDAVPDVGFSVSARHAAIVTLLLIAAALGCRFLDAEDASGAALKILSATLIVGIVPGALVTLLWRPRPQLTLLEVIGYGAAVSFGLVHLLTMLAVAVHVNAAFIVGILVIGSALMAARVIHLRPASAGHVQRSSGGVTVSLDEVLVLSLLLALGWFLYFLGSPVDSYEDQVHVAIVRRLSQLEYPRLDNFYFAPGIVYTYPFPGTHYFMALIARLGDIDALFLYHKLRFFWGPAALVMLYLTARAVFGTRAVACAVTVTAVVLACSGIFAMVPGFPFGWAQLVPYSHASDVAMTVLLPAMLVVAFGYLQAESRRERAFFFAVTAMLALMLTVVHIREMVQFAAYLGCFLAVAVAFRAFRSYVRPTVALLALVVAIAAIYTAWQARLASFVSVIVGDQRAQLVSIVTSSSLQALTLGPVSTLLGDFVPNVEQIFDGLTPFFLFTGPVVILLFRRQPLVWLISSSMVAYLAVMSVPLLAIPYIYLTYFEILYTPVRNIIVFVYLCAGAALYVLVVGLTRIDRTRLSPLVAGIAGGALALLTSLCLNRSGRGFFVPLIAAYGLTFLFLRGEPLRRKISARTVVAALVGLLALVALWPDHPPVPRTALVNVRWSAGLPEARRAALERQFTLTEGEPTSAHSADVNVWYYRLHDLSSENVRSLVTNPAVVDTHQIERSSFTVPPQPPETDHPVLGVEHVSWLQYPGLMLSIGTAMLVWALGLIVPAALASSRGRQAVTSLAAPLREPFHRRAVPFALCIIPFALWSARPSLSPLPVAEERPAAVATPRTMIAQTPCVTTPRMPARFTEDLFPDNPLILPEQTTCPPDYALIEWVKAHVPVSAVFAIDRWNPYVPSLFMSQQVVAFPSFESAFLNEKNLFSDYYRFFDERMRQYRVQPFFNSVETPAERAAFIEALGVTHVLVDPAYYDELRPVLDGLPEQFAVRYANAKWAVYEATQRLRGAGAGAD